MPSFDLVSKLDMGELKNILNMAEKTLQARYDFKGSNAGYELKENSIELRAEDETKMRAALDILRTTMAKRNIGQKSMEAGDIVPSGNRMYKQELKLRMGIDKEQGKVINKLVKDSGTKVTSQYMDEKIRLTSKSIDELQEVYRMLREHDDVKLDLQMENMKR